MASTSAFFNLRGFLFLIIILASQSQLGVLEPYGNAQDHLGDDTCANLAAEGKCEAEPGLMAKYCTKTFYQYRTSQEKKKLYDQKRDLQSVKSAGSFYDLSGTTIKGTTLKFERFEGYITLVAFVPKACDEGKAAEKILETLQHVHAVWPWIVEIVAFPFEHPDSHYYATEADCISSRHYENALEKRMKEGKLVVHAMQEIGIHDHAHKKKHPVYKYFQDVFHFQTISAKTPTVFLVSADGDLLEVFYDGSKTNVEDSVRKHLKTDY